MKTPKPILERRRSVRIADELPFKIGHAEYQTFVKTVNISEHGALCLVDQNIPLMTQLAIAITIPPPQSGSKQSKTICMTGVVVRREKDPSAGQYFLAIYFSEIKLSDRKILTRYIQHRLSGPQA